ncbi:hypothetical protein [Paenibacillus donghaensis]|uniref:Uncharacterized protein n=1 Tax=Paenibacillus donghaensis TaxID=414771 RepID=A0A2Z2KJW7_9BACL|nr:hypothetical protein [Paenibacillus donghaensis]ASA22629.1 hypothetical protein B9T62_18655 [Paenibacillus donghaensis]
MIDKDYFAVYKNKVRDRYRFLKCNRSILTAEQIRKSMDKLGESVLLSEEIIKEREERRF